MIIDVHTHIFKKWAGINNGLPVTSERFGKVKVGNYLQQVMPPIFENSNSTLEMLLANMEAFDIDKAIILSNGGYGYNNEYLLEAVNLYPNRFKALALVDITGGKRAADELVELVSQKGFCGLKIETLTCFQCSENYDLDDEQLSPVWECCNDLKIIVMLHISRSNDIMSLEKLTKRYNGIKYIVAHLGSETVFEKGKLKESWIELLRLVKENNNIWLDTSSVSNYLSEDFNYIKTPAAIEEAYKMIGPEKLLWASDYPCMLLYATYKQLLDIIRVGCKEIPSHHKDLILGKNALELFWG